MRGSKSVALLCALAFSAPVFSAKLTNTYQITSTPAVIVGGKYAVKFADWQSGMQTVDLLIDKVREEQKTQPAK